MSIFTKLARDIFAPVNSAGQPRKIDPGESVVWGTEVESVIGMFLANGGLIYETRASLFADLAHPANTSAWVVADPTVGHNGIYRKSGTSGAGAWTRVADLPYSFIRLYDAGAGTASAIVATSSVPLPSAPSAALLVMNVAETNPGPVTIAANGTAAKPLRTNSGNELAPGYLATGMLVSFLDEGASFRLLSDVASSAIVAAAEAAAAQAADYANFARNNWVANGPFVGTGAPVDYPLTIDPGSANNMFVVVGGVAQLITQDAYSLVYSGGSPYIRISVPAGVPFEVRVSNAIPVNTPADGSVTSNKFGNGSVTTPKIADANVTTPKLADDAVTFAKLQNVATARLLGRVTAGAGDAEEVAPDQLRDTFLPNGAVVDRTYAAYSSAAGITSNIPTDYTAPQNSEGTEILSVTITPKKVTNRLRISFVSAGSCTGSSFPSAIIWAIFQSGSPNAIQAGRSSVQAADFLAQFGGQIEFVPGVTTAVTISVRVGVPTSSGNTLRLNQAAAGYVLGGVERTTLVVEEIKG